jgi:trigger factor
LQAGFVACGVLLVKVTTEKLPKSLVALDIELDREQVERGLDRAARRISQKVAIPGFRKGKAPRFIVENYYGRAALIEEASDDLINRSFREALEQQQIEPVGPASLESANFDEEPFRFRVTVPVEPTVTLPDYRAIQVPLEIPDVTDEMVAEAMNERRERHVVLRALEEPRPARQGDQLTVQIESFLDGKPLDERPEGQEPPETTVILEPDRLIAGLFEGLLGIEVGETREITAHMPADHENENVRDKDVLFKVTLKQIQERILPEWDELPVLEEVEGTLDDLREATRTELAAAARATAERNAVNTYVEQLVAATSFDIPDALITRQADRMLHEQETALARYGITLEQMLQYRGQTHDQAVEELKPQAEERLRTTLALTELARAEGLNISEAEIDAEVSRLVETYSEEQRDTARSLLSNQLRAEVANSVLNKKLHDRLLALATGRTLDVTYETRPETTAEAEGSTGDDAGESLISRPETTAEAEGSTDSATTAETSGEAADKRSMEI